MGHVWRPEARWEEALKVEKAVAQVQARHGLIPKEAAEAISTRGNFNLQRIAELELEVKHDVIAFVSSVAESVGPLGRYVHYGLTSSDVLDTALSLQILNAGRILRRELVGLIEALKASTERYADVLCAGRTHGMHAEPTTFGHKLAGHWQEMKRSLKRLDQSLEQARFGKLSGAVGTYSFMNEELESEVLNILGLKPEVVATQVIPRDRHADVLNALAVLGAGLERLAVEIRHLQRSEVGEVAEGFKKGQKGSSAMPHKRNPIGSENITGCARLLRSYAAAGLEDIALWHERDISHSSVERVIFPDAFVLCDYAVHRMANLIAELEVNSERMLENMNRSRGQIFSSHVLLALVNKGLSREEAYQLTQSLALNLKANETLLEKAKTNKQINAHLDESELSAIFSGQKHREAIRRHIDRLLRDNA